MYPTKEEILKEKPIFEDGTIPITKLWKREVMKTWKKDNNSTKISNLKILITFLSKIHNKNPPTVLLDANIDYYNVPTKTIFLSYKNPSIISALHETAHHLFGSSEKKACQWSIWLFKECFPDSYKKLNWKGHLLTKGNTEKRSKIKNNTKEK